MSATPSSLLQSASNYLWPSDESRPLEWRYRGAGEDECGVWGFVPTARAARVLRGSRTDCEKRAGSLIISSQSCFLYIEQELHGVSGQPWDGPQKIHNTARVQGWTKNTRGSNYFSIL